MYCCITYRNKKFFYKTSDSWTSFDEIDECEFDQTQVDDSGKRRYVKYNDITIVTNNFWRTYTISKKNIKLTGMIDDSKNKKVNRRYCVSDEEFVVTDDFWRTFYFSKYPGDRVFDGSKVLKTRITAINDNKTIVRTSNFYKEYDVIYSSTVENNEDRIKDVCAYAKNEKFFFDPIGSNAQKKCLCYTHYTYEIGKVLMLKLDELHFNPKYIKKVRDDGYGSEFEVFAMQRIMNLDLVLDNIVGGSNDGKVDAIFKLNDKKINCFQIKFITEIPPSDIFVMKNNVDMAVDRQHYNELPSDCRHLKEFMEKNPSLFNKNPSINIVSEPVESAVHIEGDMYSVFDGKRIIKYRYYNSSDLVYQYVSDYLLGKLGKRQLSIRKKNNSFVRALNCENYFLFANAKELCEEISSSFSTKEEVDELFINNVRGYLGINKNMLNTIKDNGLKFSLFNNGVSICCEKIDDEDDDTFFILDNPFIVNGQQTILTLYHAYKNNIDLSNVEVPIFIKPYNDDENQMLEVAECNNTQNPVKDIDLLCGNLNVRKIAKKIYEIDTQKHGNDFKNWLSLKMFSTGSNSNIEISSTIIDSDNIVGVNDYFKVLLPILFHYKGEADGKIDMHLKSFNKSTTRYRDLYKALNNEIEYFLNDNTDFFYDIASSVKFAKAYVKDTAYLPAENLFGIANYYGVSSDDLISKLNEVGYDVNKTTKENIYFLTKVDVCNELQDFFVSKKQWLVNN